MQSRLESLPLFVLIMAVAALHGRAQTAVQPLHGTWHNDWRGTQKLIICPPVTRAQPLSPRREADAFLVAHSGEFRIPPNLSNLTLSRVEESLAGTHLHYQQHLNGIPVEDAEIVVSINRGNGAVYQAYNNTYPVTQVPRAAKPAIDPGVALDAAWQHLKVHGKLRSKPIADLMYSPSAAGFRLIYKTSLNVEGPDGEWEHKIDALSGEVISARSTIVDGKDRRTLPDFTAYKGAIVSRKDAMAAFDAATSPTIAGGTTTVTNGTALVFDPDPRTALKSESLVDSSPASAFTAAYVTRPLRDISYKSGVFSLSGPWVKISNFEPPSTAPSTTTNGQWSSRRGNNAFNDVMTYFFVDSNQRYLQSLGFTNIQHGPISADSDGLSGADNSHYAPRANQIAFGHGGVDDNEDADVILHEYGHAITYSIIPSWGGGDSAAIGEGFGDYWGGSFSYSTTNGASFHPEWAFSWDGHSADSWPGRLLNMTNLTYSPLHTYIDHETIDGIDNYSDQLWSAPLFQSLITLVAAGYPRTNVDTIVIESFYGVSGNPTMRDMAYATVNAASNLFPSAPYARVLYDNFARQRILPLPPPQLQYPVGGEIFMTGSVVHVRWDNQMDSIHTNAISTAVTELQCQLIKSQGWTTLYTAPSNTSRYSWVLPSTPSTNCQLQVRHSGPGNVESSGWAVSQPFTISADSDHDGIPDAWEILNFGNLTNAGTASDFDRDGACDRDEYYAGTFPAKSNSLFAISTISNFSGNTTLLQWRSVTNREYSVFLSTNLSTGFSLLSSNLPATPSLNYYLDTHPEPIRFYRIQTQF